MKSVPEKGPTEDGEKLTMMDRDFPGSRLNEPPPVATVNGLERLLVSMFPSSKPVEVGRLVMIRVWLVAAPTTTLLKFAGLGLTSILTTGAAPVPPNGTVVGLL